MSGGFWNDFMSKYTPEIKSTGNLFAEIPSERERDILTGQYIDDNGNYINNIFYTIDDSE